MSNNNGNENESDDVTKKYKGVRKRKWGKWVSEIRLPNSRERIWLGSFESPEKAARAFDAAQFCLRGPYSHFNFPDSLPPPDVAHASLSPHQIQALATAFANQERHHYDHDHNHNHNSASSSAHHHDHNNINTTSAPMESSFFNILDYNDNNTNNTNNAFFSGELHKMHSGEFCIPEPDYTITSEEDHIITHDDDDHQHHYFSHQHSSSFLWNF